MIKRFVLSLINVAICALTVFSAWGGVVSPQSWVLPSFAVMVFPVMAVATTLLLAADLIIAAFRMALIPLATILLCGNAFLSFCPLNFGTARKESAIPASDRLTLATYNVLDFYNLCEPSRNPPANNPSVSWIIREKPDIICFQELSSLERYGRSRLSDTQADSLTMIYPYRLIGPGVLGIMSKYPVKQLPSPMSNYGTFDIECYEASLGKPGRNATIINLHMQSLGLSEDDKALYRELTKGDPTKQELSEFKTGVAAKLAAAFRERGRQADSVRQFIDTLDGDVIICGDFNDVPGCYAERTIMGDDFRDSYRDGATGPAWTYNRERMYFRIDHIYYRGNLSAVRTIVDRNRGSDHYPLMTTFRLDN